MNGMDMERECPRCGWSGRVLVSRPFCLICRKKLRSNKRKGYYSVGHGVLVSEDYFETWLQDECLARKIGQREEEEKK